MGILSILIPPIGYFNPDLGKISRVEADAEANGESYELGEAQSPITGAVKDYLSESVEAICNPDVVDFIPEL